LTSILNFHKDLILKFIKAKARTALCLLIGLSINLAQAQSDEEHSSDHEHHRHEIGMANSPVYYLKEKIFAYGLHAHYLYSLEHTKFALGLGYERIFDEHKHSTYSLVFGYRPAERLSLIASPGITYEQAEPGGAFSLHLEASYEYEIGNIHIGPVFEVAYDPEDIHLSLGLHLGFGF